MSDFPLMLRIFYTEECAVRKAREALTESRTATQHGIAELKADHTPVDFLLALAKRPPAKTMELEEQRKELSRNESAEASLAFIERQLALEIENGTENHLRESNEAYARGIANLEHIADWKRAITRLREAYKMYLQEVGQARNAASANYNHQQKEFSVAAQHALFKAALAGSQLEKETAFVNRIASLHREMVNGTPTAGALLPCVPEGTYSAWIQNLKTLAIGPMQAEFDRILELCERIAGAGITELETQAADIDAQRQKLSRSYVLSYIDLLRDHAAQHWLKPAELDQIIARLQKRYRAGAQIPYSFAGE